MRMRQGTSNVSVHQQLDSKIREGQKNISYLQESLGRLQLTQSSQLDAQASQTPAASHIPATLQPGQNPQLTHIPLTTQQPGPGIPKTRNYTKLGMFFSKQTSIP